MSRQVTTCLDGKQLNLNPDTIVEEFSRAERTYELLNFFKKYCKVWPEVHGCIQPMVTSTEKCLTSDEKRTVEKTLSLVGDTNTFLCENNAYRIIRLLVGGVTLCLNSVGEDIKKCAIIFVSKPINNLLFDAETCSDFQAGRKCITSSVSKCESKDPSEVVGDYLTLVQDKVCSSASNLEYQLPFPLINNTTELQQKFHRSSASSLSWFSLANILSLVRIYLYSRMF
ncbi:27 kDa hemolymph protein-like isoform X2 [Diabrotica virgifera virgifera]|nr:27 kDa hemolymph protein-like isoform X2 [Diabrotica virgifera virgifera]